MAALDLRRWAGAWGLCLALASTHALGADIQVLAANALKEALVPLAQAYSVHSPHTVTLRWGGTEAITRRLQQGEHADLVIVAAPNIEQLIQTGLLQPGSRSDFAHSGIGVAVRRGYPHPDIGSPEALKQAMLAAPTVAYSSGPSGAHIAALLQRLGVTEALQGRIRQPASGVQIGDLLARGEADLGFQQISELQHGQGFDYLGPLPAALQQTTVYAIGLHRAARNEAAARELLRALVSPEAAPWLTRAGMAAPHSAP